MPRSPFRLAPAVRPVLARQFGSLTTFNYRVYFFGQMVSLVGTWMQTTAQAWLVLKLSNSAFALGTVTMLQFLPITLLTLFGGVIADRVPKRRLLITTQTLALIQAAVLGVLVATDVVQVWQIYLLALWLGTVNALDNPTRQAFVVELVGREQLANAVALNSAVFNTARIIGPAVAGVTIALVGLSTAFFVNAASFVAVIAAYFAMRPAQFQAQPPRRGQESILAQVGEGLRYSYRTPEVFIVLLLVGIIGTFGYNFTVVIPLVAEFILHVDAARFGFVTSCMGAGSLAAALAVAAVGRASLRLLFLAATAFSILFLGMAFSPWFWLTSVVLVFLGFAGVAFTTVANTSLQLSVSDVLRGRVMSIYVLLFAGSTPIGGWLTGAFGSAFGVPQTLVVEGVICLAGLALALAYARRQGPPLRPHSSATPAPHPEA